jgi:hypothetical protein
MSVEAITRSEFAADLCLFDDDGIISERTIADLLRAPLGRWGLSPKRAILQHAREQLTAAGVEDRSIVNHVLERLIELGECEEVFIGRERYLAPTQPRWLLTGAGIGVVLSASPLPGGIQQSSRRNPHDIVQRVSIRSDDDVAELHLAGIRQVSIEEWLTPLHYLRHAARRLRQPARNDVVSLKHFWEILTNTLAEEGLQLSSEAAVRALTGVPGTFFGRHDAPEPVGRWTEQLANGIWCAYRRGYAEAHWHPIIVAVDGQDRRVLDLYDDDEWRWALLARGRNLNSDELIIVSEESLKLSFPAPAQIRTAMDLLGVQRGPWQWERPPGSPDLWSLVV